MREPGGSPTASRLASRMAERVGFEPTVEFPLHTLSKRAHSTTRTSLRFEINALRAVEIDYLINCCRPLICSDHVRREKRDADDEEAMPQVMTRSAVATNSDGSTRPILRAALVLMVRK